MLDSYKQFFDGGYISKEKFFDFGMDNTIYADFDIAKEGWEDLKRRIQNNEKVYMRGFGAERKNDSKKNILYRDFYSQILGNEKVKINSPPNQQPTKLIEQMTKHSKDEKKIDKDEYKSIQNYQVSHVFGLTKNIYLFTAPWNIAYVPKIVDPFTGHEVKGEWADEYKPLFRQECYARFKDLIDDYNRNILTSDFKQRVKEYFEEASKDNSKLQQRIKKNFEKASKNDPYSEDEINELKKSVDKEFAPIEIEKA